MWVSLFPLLVKINRFVKFHKDFAFYFGLKICQHKIYWLCAICVLFIMWSWFWLLSKLPLGRKIPVVVSYFCWQSWVFDLTLYLLISAVRICLFLLIVNSKSSLVVAFDTKSIGTIFYCFHSWWFYISLTIALMILLCGVSAYLGIDTSHPQRLVALPLDTSCFTALL